MATDTYYQRNRAKFLARYKEKREQLIAYQKARYVKMADYLKAYQKEYYRKNIDAAKASNQARSLLNRDRINARQKAWYAANKTDPKVVAARRKQNKANLAAHPEVWRAKEGRRRAQKLNTKAEKVSYKQVLRDSKGICGICKKPLDLFGIDFDHIIPLSKGGTHTRDNIQATHSYCNRSKGAKVG